MKLSDCHNIDDFRKLAKKKLPSPIFNYIDGGADDETTLKRNTESFNKCDLVPIYIERRSKFHFKMYVSKPIKVGESKTIEEITQFLNTVLEQMIVKNPLQWIWTHDRWKK